MATPEILLVDGDGRSRAALALGLDRRGFHVSQAGSASEALGQAAQNRPSLIISEMELPDGGGLRLVEMLRRSPQTVGVPLFLLSSDTALDVLAAARLRGADEVLLKPIHVSDLAVLARIATSPDPRSFAGNLDALRLPHLLRALTSGGRSGRIAVGNGDGRILFREGRIVDAFYRHLRGEAALMRMLTLVSGPFDVEFVPVNRGGEIDFGLREVLTRGFSYVRRWEQIVSSTYSLDTRLEVDFAALRRSLGDLPDEVNRVVRLFDGKRTMLQVVDASRFDDLTALEVIGKLDALHLLRPVGSEVKSPFLVPSDASVPAAEVLLTEIFGEEGPADGPLPNEALDWFADYVKGEGTWDEILPGEETGGWVEMPAGKAVGAALIAEAIEETLGELKEPLQANRAVVQAGRAPGRFDDEPSPVRLVDEVHEDVIDLMPAATAELPQAPAVIELDATASVLDLEPVHLMPSADQTPSAPLPLTLVAPVDAGDALEAVELHWSEVEDAKAPPAELAARPPIEEPVPLDIDPSHEPFFDGAPPEPWDGDLPGPRRGRGRLAIAGVAVLLLGGLLAYAVLHTPVRVPGPSLPPPTPPVAAAEMPVSQGPLDVADSTAAASARTARALALAVSAQQLYERGEVTAAVRLAEDALSVDPASVPAGVLLGQVEVDARNTGRAIEVLEHVRQVDPNNPKAAVLLGFAYQTAGRTSDAVAQYRDYLALDPDGESVKEVKAILARLGG